MGLRPDRYQLGALGGQLRGRLLDPVAAVQPRVIADPRSVRRMLLQPLRNAGLRHRFIFPLGRADLLADLDRVAPVGEYRRFLGKDGGRSGRSLEPGQPGQPLGVAADIFAHMFVGQRNDEAIEAVFLELLAEGGETIGVRGHRLLLPSNRGIGAS